MTDALLIVALVACLVGPFLLAYTLGGGRVPRK